MDILLCVVCVLVACVALFFRGLNSFYESANPPGEESYPITFKKFLQLYESAPDYIALKPHSAKYSNYGADRVKCYFVFSMIDWLKYCNWYKQRQKLEKEAEKEYFHRRCSEEFIRVTQNPNFENEK